MPRHRVGIQRGAGVPKRLLCNETDGRVGWMLGSQRKQWRRTMHEPHNCMSRSRTGDVPCSPHSSHHVGSWVAFVLKLSIGRRAVGLLRGHNSSLLVQPSSGAPHGVPAASNWALLDSGSWQGVDVSTIPQECRHSALADMASAAAPAAAYAVLLAEATQAAPQRLAAGRHCWPPCASNTSLGCPLHRWLKLMRCS